jgi:hypothetical protein
MYFFRNKVLLFASTQIILKFVRCANPGSYSDGKNCLIKLIYVLRVNGLEDVDNITIGYFCIKTYKKSLIKSLTLQEIFTK